MRNALKVLFKLNLLTIYFNLKYFPLNVALKFPVFLIGRFSVHSLRGSVNIDGPIKTGMIRIGDLAVGIFNKRNTTILNIHGTLIFRGKVSLGKGTSLSVGKSSYLEFGDNVTITANSTIVTSDKRRVVIGANCLISWDVLIMNSDFHYLYSKDSGLRINPSKDIIIGEKVWLGTRCIILKGSFIANQSVVAAGSIVSGSYEAENAIYGGIIAKKIGEGILWEK